MGETVLFVDDNELTLQVVRDLFANAEFRVLTCDDPLAARELLLNEEIAVVVSDNIMPGMSGLELLSDLSDYAPDTVKVLMSAYADLSSALAAINRSEVFRFILKPWEPEDLVETVDICLQRHRLVKSMRHENETILCSLAQTIELKDKSTRGHCDRVAVYALSIAEALGFSASRQREIKFGSWLHDCGKIGVAEEILNGPGPLSETDFEIMKQHSLWGADVASKANLSETARNIIHYHHEYYDGNGYPAGLKGEEIPLEARIVAVADVFDALTSERSYRERYSREAAVEILRSMSGKVLDPGLVRTFLDILDRNPEFPVQAPA
jgi:response regulator RpfG family c-di-GMP phosphodiesterase